MQNPILAKARERLHSRALEVRNGASDLTRFHMLIKRFMAYIEQDALLFTLLKDLLPHTAQFDSVDLYDSDTPKLATTDVECAAVSYLFLMKYGAEPCLTTDMMVRLPGTGGASSIGRVIADTYITPLVRYLDERIENGSLMLYFLERYKHRCEWFRISELREGAEANSQRAEKTLATDLYAYLHDQGIDFTIEPNALPGAPDLIAAQRTDDPLILDAKIFDGDSRGKAYLLKGFRQVYDYTWKFNEPTGYLAIYKFCERDLEFRLDGSSAGTRSVQYNGKTIFFLTIDIHAYDAPPSKRGPLESCVITHADLVRRFDEEEDSRS